MLNFIFYNTVCLYKQQDIYKLLKFFFRICFVCVNTNLIFNNKGNTCNLNVTYRRNAAKCSNTLTFLSFLNYFDEFIQLGDIYACCECISVSYNNTNISGLCMVTHAVLHVMKYKHYTVREDVVMTFITTKIVSFLTRRGV